MSSWSSFAAMGVGNAELLSSMIEDEKIRAEEYLKKLTDKMKGNHVSNNSEMNVSTGCYIAHDNIPRQNSSVFVGF